MKKIKKIFLLILFIHLLYGCNSVKEGFSSNKKDSSDEFFVEKKAPLVMPPNYEELPIPKPENQQNEEKNDNIKKLISNENTNTNKSISSDNNNSLEKNIIDKIKN